MALGEVGFCGVVVWLGECILGRSGENVVVEAEVVDLDGAGVGLAGVEAGLAEVEVGLAKVEVANRISRVGNLD